jgi:hypothetical protein
MYFLRIYIGGCHGKKNPEIVPSHLTPVLLLFGVQLPVFQLDTLSRTNSWAGFLRSLHVLFQVLLKSIVSLRLG